MALEIIKTPDIGTDDEVAIVEILVAVGSEIVEDEGLLVLESEKASMEVPSVKTGKVVRLLVEVGQKIKQGDAICEVETTTQQTKPAESADVVAESSAEPVTVASELKTVVVPSAPTTKFHASPSVRAYARALGVDLANVVGTQEKNRISKIDVEKFVKQHLSQTVNAGNVTVATGMGIPIIAPLDFSQFGEIEVKPLARIQKLSGKHLHGAWLNVPHVTQFEKTNITELEAFRKQLNAKNKDGVKVTVLAFIIKAIAYLLKELPQFNSSINATEQTITFKRYINIGIAVDTPNGLVVPVIRSVDTKGVFDLCGELTELSVKARAGKLTPSDLSGGCFTISSLGGIGGTYFTPIVNVPEVAILGVSKSSMEPVWDGQEFKPALMLPLSLSYDHRVIDGAVGARFIVRLASILNDVKLLLL